MTVAPDALRDDPGWTRSWRQRLLLAAIAAVVTPLVRLLSLTWRYEVTGTEHLRAVEAAGHRYILALWHGRILPGLWFWRRRGIVVITSRNFDGEWIARVLGRFGFRTARGSTSRGGARALRQLVREIAQHPAAFTVDGPRGPAGIVQPGVVWLAGASGVPVLPYHTEASRHWTVRSWDRTQIPKPFARVAFVIGAPVSVPRGLDAAGLAAAAAALGARLQQLERDCHTALADGDRR